MTSTCVPVTAIAPEETLLSLPLPSVKSSEKAAPGVDTMAPEALSTTLKEAEEAVYVTCSSQGGGGGKGKGGGRRVPRGERGVGGRFPPQAPHRRGLARAEVDALEVDEAAEQAALGLRRHGAWDHVDLCMCEGGARR